MNISRLVLVTALGLGLSSTGCLGNTDPLAEDIEPPHLKTLADPGGGVGPNGLPPASFHATKLLLMSAMNSRLVTGSSQISNIVVNDSLLPSNEGKAAFPYAMRCALSSTTSVFSVNAVEYPGSGFLQTTGGWLTGGLQQGPRQDIFACILAHLNPSTQAVDILLSGASVKLSSTQLDLDQFTFDEAVWGVTVSSSFGLTLNVWPMSDLESACGRRVFSTLQTRVCGGYDGNCDINVRNDLATACTSSTSGHYTCNGQPALRTRLRPQSVSVLHNGCAPLP